MSVIQVGVKTKLNIIKRIVSNRKDISFFEYKF